MDLKEIEKLMQALEKSKITRLAIRKEGFEIELEKEAIVVTPAQRVGALEPLALEASSVTAKTEAPKSVEKPEIEGRYITSPMVGTFYLTPAPDDPPFVKVGDVIDDNSLVCIIEAMKVMNEVKSQIKGKIAEILVKSGEPVEFGTKLFKVI